jgi:heterotetrameric sarcosine oxidase gamma subunit
VSDQALLARAPYAGPAPGRFGDLAAGVGVHLQDASGRGLASIIARKGRAADLAAAAKAAFGCELPATPRFAAGRGVSFVWAGPDQWLALTDAAGDPATVLAGPFAGLAAVIDQSDSRAVLRAGGPAVRAALAKGLPIDLHERAFRPGDAALTSVGHIAVHLWQVDAAPTYELAVPRSLAESFWHWLTQSSAEFGYAVAAPG